MTITTTAKFRAFGGASALALSAGLTGTAFAQAADPLVAAPAAPTTPAQPANAVQCVEDTPDNFVCAPGTDADGVGEDPTLGDPADPITITIDDGAFVTGSTGFSSGASVTGDSGTTITNNGSIVGGANGAIIVNDDSSIVNNGFISSDFLVTIRSVDNLSLDNTGTIYGNSTAALISSREGLVLNNSGLIRNDAGTAIFSNGDGDASTVTTVNNAETGEIYSAADNEAVIEIQETAVINNEGLIQSFGNGSSAILTGANATVVNDGNIAANGDDLVAIVVGEGSSVTNNGLIQTTGASASAVQTGENSTFVNTGTITSADAFFSGAVATGNGSTITNDGSVLTSGDSQVGILTGSGSTLTNNGSIEADGTNNVFGVLGDLTGTGTGTVLNNSATGTITAVGGSGLTAAVRLGGADNIVNNDGLIEATGDGATGIDIGQDGIINNTGTVQTAGANANALNFLSTGSVSNSGTIATTGADSVAIAANDAISITNEADGVISSALSNAVQLNTTDATLVNFGLISADVEAAVTTADGDDFTIFNNGTITGGGGSAVEFGDGNDVFYALNGGTANGTVDGGAGGNTLFGLVTGADEATFNLSEIGTTYVNFGRFGFGTQNFDAADNTIDTAGTGRLVLSGSTDVAFTVLNSAFLSGDVTNIVFLQALENPNDGTTPELNLTVASGGSIDVEINDAIRLNDDGFTIVNVGLIRSNTDEAIEAEGINDLTVVNNSEILTGPSGDIAIEANDNLTVFNRGLIESATSQAIFATGTGLVIENISIAEISSLATNAITGGDDVTITNAGLISGTEGNAIEIASGTIENSGTITTTSPAMGFGAGIYFTPGAEASTVTNLAGGVIEGDFGIFADAAGTGAQTVANFGTITGTLGSSVVLTDGDDEFQQWTGAIADGDVRLGDGDDTFILEGTMSSILGTVAGGSGDNTAILGGVFDGDNLLDFGTISLGQLFDLTISGDRSVTGDVFIDGNTILGLGVDTLAVDGDLTLESGGTITVLTPLDEALLGQTIVVLEQTGTFTDNGGTFDIVDDDLLLDYTRVDDTSVAVSGVNPLATSSDANIVAISNAVSAGLTAGTLSSANFAALNDLGDIAALSDALADALPSLSESVGREIFETSSAASEALDRHLATEGTALWGQVIVRGAEQDALSPTANGYDSDQLIFTVGADFAATDGIRIGALASFADIDNEDETAAKSADVESIKLGLYAAVEFMERGFLNTELAYLTGDVETSRTGFFGNVTSGYDFDGFSVRTTLGYDLLEDENVSITPSIGVNAARINFDDVVEAGGFGFTVERGDAEYTELRGGVEFAAQMSEGVDAFIKGTVVKDLIDTPRSFRLSSAELPTFSAALPLREQDRFELAAGANIDVSETFTIGLGYLGDFNDGYSAHAARATLSFGF